MSETPILIWGAGAIGGILGAYFARAGHAVHMVDVVEEHVEAMRTTGLHIEGPAKCCRPARLRNSQANLSASIFASRHIKPPPRWTC